MAAEDFGRAARLMERHFLTYAELGRTACC
jgi:hypothetical protein